jgi:ElaB/YqjD/DUF883 family membrane-anchored ribosome-binding protein
MRDEDFAELFKQLGSGRSTTGSWHDVRVEFESLGATLGDVLQHAWHRSGDESALGRIREVLSSATQELSEAVEDTPDAQRARDHLASLANSLSAAAERASDSVRPELLRMLREANAELRRRSGLGDTQP